MRKLAAIIIIALFTTSLNAQVIPVKLAAYQKKFDAYGYVIPGKELNDFKVPDGETNLIMHVLFDVTDYKKLAVKKALNLDVSTSENGTIKKMDNFLFKPLTKNGPIHKDFGFMAGDYIITLSDFDNPDKVFAKRTITVKPNEAKAANADGFEYNRSDFKLWICKDVDEAAWKPITPLSKIKVGGCAVLFFDSKMKIKYKGSMRWGIYKVSNDGVENMVSQKDQGLKPGTEQWSKMYYEECEAFTSPGLYRIYIALTNDPKAAGNTNSDNYYQKAELIVE